MTTTPRRRRVLLSLLALAALAAASACQEQRTTTTAAADAPAVPRLTAVTKGGLVDWARPMVLTVTDGAIARVTVNDLRGYPVEGRLAPARWESTTELVPDTPYHVTALLENAAGTTTRVDLNVRTRQATTVLTAVHSPRSDRVVGVGLPAIITLNRPVTDPADRVAVVQRLSVETSPHVDGAWRWVSDKELHYRGATYWATGTRISVHSELQGLKLTRGVWGKGSVDTQFRVGSAVIATVDVAKHSMTVTVDGRLVRTLKVSTGREKYPTKGGVHLVLEKTKEKVMDSATVGIPRDAPEGYYLKVPNSVRISYGGAFVHSASWSVRDQGVRDVSHGCVNVSPADAAWFFNLVKRGDVVNIINARAKPRLSDPGTADWNIPFGAWAN